MWSNFIRTITFGVFKLILFASLVVLGIVFIPDGVIDRVERGVDWTANYLQGEAAKRTPTVNHDISQQTQETRGDLGRLYQSIKENYLPAVGSWVGDFLPPKSQ